MARRATRLRTRPNGYNSLDDTPRPVLESLLMLV
jgi:hypothetical protein